MNKIITESISVKQELGGDLQRPDLDLRNVFCPVNVAGHWSQCGDQCSIKRHVESSQEGTRKDMERDTKGTLQIYLHATECFVKFKAYVPPNTALSSAPTVGTNTDVLCLKRTGLHNGAT